MLIEKKKLKFVLHKYDGNSKTQIRQIPLVNSTI
jgi:hypothetical protein